MASLDHRRAGLGDGRMTASYGAQARHWRCRRGWRRTVCITLCGLPSGHGCGLAGVFPTLAGSEWVNGDIHTLSAAVLHGINSKLTVKGQTYNGAMPTFGSQISDAELAAVLTHVRRVGAITRASKRRGGGQRTSSDGFTD